MGSPDRDEQKPEIAPSIADRPLLLCLLPVRNAAEDLPGFFASLRHYCDGVIALDDGSTDTTRRLLEAEPLVWKVLANPVRADYRGWNDAANRNILLRAAGEFRPQWILSLDADEQIDAADGQALRTFLEKDALPGCAYGFRNAPMHNDLHHFLPHYVWVYRLFAYTPRQRFPTQKLHFVPVPTSIPRERWVKTTLRIQHLGELTAERRLARFTKYLEVDPQRRYQDRYIESLRVVDDQHLGVWLPRPPDLPVLLAEAEANLLQPGETDVPAFSVIVMLDPSDEGADAVLESVVTQVCSEAFEIILIVDTSAMMVGDVRVRHPHITIMCLPEGASPGERRNAGLWASRGTFVLFLTDRFTLLPDNLETRLAAHRLGYTMVSDVLVPETPSPAGWARYFLAYADRLMGSPAQALTGPPAVCSYARLQVQESGGFPEAVWEDEDQIVNRELFRRGYLAFRESASEVSDQRLPQGWWAFLWQQFQDGRGIGRQAVASHRQSGMLLTPDTMRAVLIGFVPEQVRSLQASVIDASPDLYPIFRQVLPGIVVGVVATWMGMWWELLRPAAGKWDVLFGRPTQMVLLAETDGDCGISLVQADHLGQRIAVSRVAGSTSLPALSIAAEPGEAHQLATYLAQTSGSDVRQMKRDLERSLDIDGLEVIMGSGDVLASLMPTAYPDKSPIASGLLVQGLRAWRAVRRGEVRTSLSLRSLVTLVRIGR